MSKLELAVVSAVVIVLFFLSMIDVPISLSMTLYIVVASVLQIRILLAVYALGKSRSPEKKNNQEKAITPDGRKFPNYRMLKEARSMQSKGGAMPAFDPCRDFVD